MKIELGYVCRYTSLNCRCFKMRKKFVTAIKLRNLSTMFLGFTTKGFLNIKNMSNKCRRILKWHRRIHIRGKSYQCKDCRKTFSKAQTSGIMRQFILDRDLTNIMSGKDFNQCSRFTHQKIHIGEIPYKCSMWQIV